MPRSIAPTARLGISTFELLGCLLAVAGGVWIGAQYVGLDLHGAAYQALDESELLTKIPADWRPANPDCPDGDCPSEEEVRLAIQSELRVEFEALQQEVAQLTGDELAVDQQETSDASALSVEDQLTREQTKSYWQSLSRIVDEVATIQGRVNPLLGTEQHARAMAARRRALSYGAEAVALLETEQVDPEAVTTGLRVAEWYEHGAETLKAALEIKSHQAVDGRSMSGSDLWATTEANLAKRTDLVRRKSRETSAYLSGRYFFDFPALAL